MLIHLSSTPPPFWHNAQTAVMLATRRTPHTWNLRESPNSTLHTTHLWSSLLAISYTWIKCTFSCWLCMQRDHSCLQCSCGTLFAIALFILDALICIGHVDADSCLLLPIECAEQRQLVASCVHQKIWSLHWPHRQRLCARSNSVPEEMWVCRVGLQSVATFPSCLPPMVFSLPVVLTKYLKRRVHSTVNLLTGQSTVNTTEADVCAVASAIATTSLYCMTCSVSPSPSVYASALLLLLFTSTDWQRCSHWDRLLLAPQPHAEFSGWPDAVDTGHHPSPHGPV